MRSLSDDKAHEEIIARIESLGPENERRWGRLQSDKMLCHLADQFRLALKDIPFRQRDTFLRYPLLRYLFIHVLPWPKGKAKGPREAFTTVPASWDADRAALLELIERFVRTPPDELASTHPLFGAMSARDWDVLSYRHLDYHLRQFSA